MAKVDLKALKDGLVELQAYASVAADKVVIFPTQGLGSHYLSQITFKTNQLLRLLEGETNNDKLKREQFFANQYDLLSPGADKAEAADHVQDPGRTEPKAQP